MAKKTFKENPALQFISSMSNDYNTHNTDGAYNADNMYSTDNTVSVYNTDNKQQTQSTQERKTKRLNLLIQPSILEDLGKIAYMKKTSTNDLINLIIRDYTAAESALITKYNEIFP